MIERYDNSIKPIVEQWFELFFQFSEIKQDEDYIYVIEFNRSDGKSIITIDNMSHVLYLSKRLYDDFIQSFNMRIELFYKYLRDWVENKYNILLSHAEISDFKTSLYDFNG